MNDDSIITYIGHILHVVLVQLDVTRDQNVRTALYTYRKIIADRVVLHEALIYTARANTETVFFRSRATCRAELAKI